MIFNSMGTTIKTLLKEGKQSILKLESNIITNNYRVIENDSGKYYTIRIPKNATVSEFDNSDICYVIEDENGRPLIENITDVFTPKQINALRNEIIVETKNELSSDSDSEVIDYVSDLFDKNGFKPVHIINYDKITTGYEMDVIVIINGSLESIYVRVNSSGDISIVESDGDMIDMGNMEDYSLVLFNFKKHLKNIEDISFMVN
jgi:hypothetical protein